MTTSRGALLCLLLSGVCAGQTTHTVGPGGFAQINDAIAVAAPGDVIVVQAGTYNGFQLSFGLTIRGVNPGTVIVGGPSAVSLGAQQAVHLVDLGLTALAIQGGVTSLDRCSNSGFLPNVTVTSASVHMQQCTFVGFAFFSVALPALDAISSDITAIDCVFDGGSSGYKGSGPASEAVRLQGSVLNGSNLTMQGGSNYVFLAQPALRAIASTVWLSDSTCAGGTAQATQVCSVVADNGRFVRCTFLSPPCTAIDTTGHLLGLHRPSPLQSPGPFTLDFQTDPNEGVAVFVDADLATITLPELEQSMLLSSSASPIGILLADASGLASGTWNVPAGVANRTWWVQGVSGLLFPLQVSPVAGGWVR